MIRNIHLLLFSLLFSVAAMAQLPERVRHINELFLIENGTDVFIKGGLEHMQGNIDNIILNQGAIHVGDSMVNNANIYIFGTLPDTLGHVYFRGNSTQGFGGNSIVLSSASFRNGYDSLVLEIDTLMINHRLMLDSGNLDLNGNQLFLKRVTYASSIIEGTLYNEDEDDNVYGYPGIVRMQRPLQTGATYSNLHGTGLDLKSEGNLGATVEIRRLHDEQGASNGSIKKFFTFNPAQSDDISNVGFQYLDTNDLNQNDENELALYISHDNGLSYRDKAGSVNTGNNKLSSGFLFPISNQTRITLSEDSCDVLPAVEIGQDTLPLCDGTQVTITANGLSGMDVRWSNGLANIDSITVDTSGMFWVRVENAEGCVNYDTVQIVDAPNPVVGFTNTFACQGDSTEFTDTTSISSGEALSHAWAFGDPFKNNDYSTDVNPKYKYTQFGTFQATLIVESASGCSASKQKSVVVLPNPNAQFSLTNACADSTVTFTNQSTVSGSAGLTHKWFFGDGDSLLTAAASHSYDTTGSYQVTLISTSNGCVDSAINTVNIYPNPTANFILNNVCEGTQTMIMNASSIDSGSLSYSWVFDQQLATTDANPILSYDTSGLFGIHLTIASSFGCTDTFSDSILIHSLPSADFTFSSVCESDSTVFTNASNVASGSLSYTWDFGSNSQHPTHLFGADGAYSVQLLAVSDSGCVDSITKTVTVFPNPTAGFNFGNVCLGNAMAFQNNSGLSSGTLAHAWDFGGASTSALNNPQFTFTTSGQFDVQLITTSLLGCQDSITQQVEVFALPAVDLGADTLSTCGSSLILDAQNSGSQFAWSNGSTAQTITVLSNGFYRVSVTDGNSCMNADTAYISLFTAVNPNLGPDKIVCDSVQLISGFPSVNTQFNWNNSASTNNIWVTTTGQYEVTVTDQNGCEGYDTVLVTVNQSPIIDLGANQTACNGENIVFDAGNAGSTYAWSNGANTQSISVQTNGNYSVTVTTPQNCSSNDQASASFNALPVFSLGADANVCDSVDLTANVSAPNYNWNNGESVSTIQVTSSGEYICTVSFASGCSFADTINITVNASPIVDLGADTIICSGDSLTIDAQNALNSFSWNTGSSTQTITVGQSGTFIVTVTTPENCSESDQMVVTKKAEIVVDLGSDFVLCDSATKQLNAGFENGSYNWGSTSGFAANTQQVTVADSGFYWVDVLDQDGCAGSDTVKVTASNLSLNAAFLARTTLSLGDTIQFINLSEPAGYTSFWSMGDGFTTTAQNPTHPYFVSQTYEVMLAVGNGVCADTVTKSISIEQLKTDAIAYAEESTTFKGFLRTHLFPNPNRGTFTVEVELEDEDELNMTIYNMQGAIIDHTSAFGYNIRKEFSYNSLPSGMYFVRCYNGRAVKSLKFIVLD